MPPSPVRAFTADYNGLSPVLGTIVGISASHVLSGGDQPEPRTYSAIWDTGATATSITAKVVQECGLAPITVASVTGVHGTQQANVYLIDVYLPNAVRVETVKATEMALVGDDVDVLIGMDVIGLGDLAVTNFQGKTSFTFRIPSVTRFDFAADAKRTPSKKAAGRNDPCPCGSGRKYKRCCGR